MGTGHEKDEWRMRENLCWYLMRIRGIENKYVSLKLPLVYRW